MKSVYLKNFFATAITLTLCFIIVATCFLFIGRKSLINLNLKQMGDTADEVGRLYSAMNFQSVSDDVKLQIFLTSIGNCTDNIIIITDSEEKIVACSEAVDFPYINTVIDVVSLSKDGSRHSFDGLTDLGGILREKRLVIFYTLSEDDGENERGHILICKDLKSMLDSWRNLQKIMMIVVLIVFTIVLANALLFSRTMSRPLDEMAKASVKFAKGDFSARVAQVSDTDDEMGTLIDSFNKMAISLENAEKRRNEFISNISHELRTPMTTISGFADGILDGTIPPEDEKKYLIVIRDETLRLSRLVRNMLDVSRTKAAANDPGRRTAFDITELVLQTLLSFESRAVEKNLEVEPQLPDSTILVKADKDAITRVIYNLIDNAVKFAYKDSCLTIRIYKDDRKAYVSVKNQGDSIPESDLPFIFDRFHKSDKSRSMDKDGVGLGLYLVKEIINQHDEDIICRSENSVTEFVFTLALV